MNGLFLLEIDSLYVLSLQLPKGRPEERVEPMFIESSLQHLILGMAMAFVYPTFRRFKYPYLFLLLAHPFLIEGVQLFMPSRTVDASDIYFGLIGTLLGFCLV
jgi:VanZ family protein